MILVNIFTILEKEIHFAIEIAALRCCSVRRFAIYRRIHRPGTKAAPFQVCSSRSPMVLRKKRSAICKTASGIFRGGFFASNRKQRIS
ncbi:MAG TPA: hypothetical protein DEP43_00335 [Ruminococcaceae bacterium]|nr:hypothetical protein [Oscillospiraceae bacterium]